MAVVVTIRLTVVGESVAVERNTSLLTEGGKQHNLADATTEGLTAHRARPVDKHLNAVVLTVRNDSISLEQIIVELVGVQLGAVNRASLGNLLLGEDSTTLLAFEHLNQLSHRTTNALDVSRFGGDIVLLVVPIFLRFTERNDDGIEIHRLGKRVTSVATPV